MTKGTDPATVRALLKRLAGTDVVVDLPRRIDRSVRYHGTVVAVGPRLVHLRALDDFAFSGTVVLRISDIIEVRIDDTQRTVRRLIRGTLAPAPVALDLRSWSALFQSIERSERFAIVENEQPGDEDFDLGPVLGVNRSDAELRSYDSSGRTWPYPTRLRFARITCVRLQNTYVEAFERHARGAVPPPRGKSDRAWPPEGPGVEARGRASPSSRSSKSRVATGGTSAQIANRSRPSVRRELSRASARRYQPCARTGDFEFDGWAIVRLRDLATVRRRDSEKFHERVIAAEGHSAPQPPAIDLTDWRTALRDVAASGLPVQAECEAGPGGGALVVGQLESVGARTATFRAVSSTARWWPGTTKVPLRALTVVYVGNRYARTLVDHAKGSVPRKRTGPRM